MPRPPCISIPFKKTAEVDWVRPMRQYIARSYQEDPDAYSSDCQILQRMRQDMRGANADETGRDLIFRYYSHLEALEPRFKVNEQGVKVTFMWSDAFTGESTQQHSLAFEKAGVLFNLAVAFGMHGASLFADSATSEMGLTTIHTACIYFQVAADRFNYLNENFLHAPSLDLQQETVNVLNGIMMAQAQECALTKSRLEKKKDATLSKLAQQTALMYSNVFDNLKAIIDSNQLPRGWLLLVETKLRYYQAMAQYHEAHSDETKSRYGFAVARYSLAEQHAREATKLVGQFAETFFSTASLTEDLHPESVQGLQELITNLSASIADELSKATYDNDVIYHETVPNTSTLPPLDAASVVSNFDINKFYASEERSNVVGSDLFQRLIPMNVHESSSLYSEEMAKMLRAEEDKVNLADGELQDALSFMKMPGSLKRFERPLAATSPNGRSGIASILAELAEPNAAVREAVSAVQTAERSKPLSEMRARVMSQRVNASEELADFSRMLDDEQRASEQALTEYASEPLFVSYQPSSRAAAFYREQISDHQKKLEDAAALDNSILNDYQTAVAPWLPTLKNGTDGVASVILEHLKEIKFEEAANVYGAGGESLVDIGQDQPVGLSGHVQEIKNVYEQLLELRKIRRTTLSELKTAVQEDDISSSLIKATSAKDLQPLFARELRKYDPQTQRLQATSTKQAQLIKRLSEEFRCLMELPQARTINDKWEMSEGKKAAVTAQIMDACQVYQHVSDGLDKANRFYSMLIDSLGLLRGQVKDFVASRANQRDQLIKKVVQDSAARNHAALKERLNQYASPPQQQQPQQQQQQQRGYQPPMQNTYSPQHGPTQSPSVHSAQTFDVNHLVNQTAQMGLHSPPGMSATLPPVVQQQPPQQQRAQPPYSPNGASAPQYQPSAPPPPPQMMQQQAPIQPPQQNQQPSYLPQHTQQQPMYGYQQQQQQQPQHSVAPAYGNAPTAVPDMSMDPYSASVRRSTVLEPNNIAHSIGSSTYKPGYGGYTTTSAPIQQTGAGPAGGYNVTHSPYGVNVSAPPVTSSGYAPAPHTIAVPHHHPPQPQQQQQTMYGSYSEPSGTMVSTSIMHPAMVSQQQQQPMMSAYAPPPFPPPPQVQNHHHIQQQQQQQPPASFGSTVASNTAQPPPQMYHTPPIQQQPQQQKPQQAPQYMSQGQPMQQQQQQQPLGQAPYQHQYNQMNGQGLQTIGQNLPGVSAAYPGPAMQAPIAGGNGVVVPTSVGYQQPSYLPQQHPQQQQQRVSLPPIQQQQPPVQRQSQYNLPPSMGYQPPPQQQQPPPQQQQQQPLLNQGYNYQYSAPPQQQPQQQMAPPPIAGSYGGPVPVSQPPMQQMAPPAAAPVGYGQQQQQQQPSYLPPPVQQQQLPPPQQQQPQQQQPYHHGYGGNHGSLMD
ncbi:bck1-like resistance to osmotic shock [Coemansia sp. Benny D115]|nr:bck1-like resistance to osmotic shock [Coemansia sp. Benny D115]